MDLASLLGPRSVEDTLAERIVLWLDGVRYVLPVKSMRANRAWEEELDTELVQLLNTVREDGDDLGAVLRALANSPGRFIDLLLAYDDHDILPDHETVYGSNTEMGLLAACLEVWRAAHPLADIGIELFAMSARRENALAGLTSSLFPSGDTTTEGSRPN